VAEQVLSMYAGTNGFRDDVPVSKVRQFEDDLLHYVSQHHPQVKKDLVAKGKIDEAFGKELKEIMSTFKQTMGYNPKP
jgi:F-type H+/Na+-transporting ATPase subunit alpha